MDRNQKLIGKYKTMLTQKMRWHSMFQLVGEYVHLRKQDFQTQTEPGDFITEQVFDSTAPKSLRQFAAALGGMIWQSAKTSMKIIPVEGLENKGEVKEYFHRINKTVSDAMDDVKAGLSIAIEEWLADLGSFGTAGIGVFDGQDDSDLLFISYGVDTVVIREGANGFVNLVYELKCMKAEQVIEKWGDKCSKKIYDMCEAGKGDTDVKILHCVEKRLKYNPDKKDSLNKPYQSIYIDYESGETIHESGFDDMPIFISRFYKRRKEVYGRSPSMDAMPDIMEVNTSRESRILAIEKALDPPLGIFHDSVVGNGKVDTSAGAINVVDGQSRTGTNPIFPLYNFQNIREVDKSIEELQGSIKEHFLLDRLLDTANKVQMTLGEVQLRNQIKAESLGSIFARLLRETINPLIIRSVDILFSKGKLGSYIITKDGQISSDDIPPEVLELIALGQDFYEIRYTTPAIRIVKAEQVEAMNRVIQAAASYAQSDPAIMDKIDLEEALEELSRIYGVDSMIMRSDNDVQKIRDQRAQMQQMQQEAMIAKETAEIQKLSGEAAQANEQTIA